MPWRREKRAAPKRFRPAAPKPTTAHLPLPEAPAKPKNDVPDRRPLPSVSVPVCKSTPWPGTGKMSSNLFEDRNWLLLPNYLDNGSEHKTENEPKNAAGVASPGPQLKERKNPRQMTKSQKMQLGTRLPLLQESRKGRLGWQTSSPATKSYTQTQNYKKSQARRPKALSLNMTKAKQQWEAEMERLNSKYNLDCFSDSELDSESDEREQYHYEHGYETLI